jgi:hypothetical protein
VKPARIGESGMCSRCEPNLVEPARTCFAYARSKRAARHGPTARICASAWWMRPTAGDAREWRPCRLPTRIGLAIAASCASAYCCAPPRRSGYGGREKMIGKGALWVRAQSRPISFGGPPYTTDPANAPKALKAAGCVLPSVDGPLQPTSVAPGCTSGRATRDHSHRPKGYAKCPESLQGVGRQRARRRTQT